MSSQRRQGTGQTAAPNTSALPSPPHTPPHHGGGVGGGSVTDIRYPSTSRTVVNTERQQPRHQHHRSQRRLSCELEDGLMCVREETDHIISGQHKKTIVEFLTSWGVHGAVRLINEHGIYPVHRVCQDLDEKTQEGIRWWEGIYSLSGYIVDRIRKKAEDLKVTTTVRSK